MKLLFLRDLTLPALDELINTRYLLEPEQTVDAIAYTFANEMPRDVVYTEARDANLVWLFWRMRIRSISIYFP